MNSPSKLCTTKQEKIRVKEWELDSARSLCPFPITDEELCMPTDALKALLMIKLVTVMREFREAVESLGFTY